MSMSGGHSHGVKMACALNEIHGFQVTQNFVLDLMHTLLGVVPFELHCIPTQLVNVKGYFSMHSFFEKNSVDKGNRGRHIFHHLRMTAPQLPHEFSALYQDWCRMGHRHPRCPVCSGPTKFSQDGKAVFGWIYRCENSHQVSRSEAHKRHLKHTWVCSGTVSATTNTWMADSKNITKTLGLLFCWLNRITVTAAAAATDCSPNTATVDHYSMAREVCEVIVTNEVTSWHFGGPGIQVEVDECFLTRRKNHKGRRMRSGTVTLFGIYERATNPGFHLQVRDRSQAVLISEIQRFIEPGTHIISDGMASYQKLPEYGYVHGVVIQDKETGWISLYCCW